MEYLQKRDLFDWRAPDRAQRVELLHARSGKLHVDADHVRAARKRAEARLEDMLAYVDAVGCRRSFLLSYFGEQSPTHCGSCDVCLQRHEPYVPSEDDRPALRRVLAGVEARRPRSRWFEEGGPAGYQVDRLLNWLINEGYLRQTQPLGDRFDLTEKGRLILRSPEWNP